MPDSWIRELHTGYEGEEKQIAPNNENEECRDSKSMAEFQIV